MRIAALLTVLAATVAAAGCASPVVALHSFVADRDAAVNPALAGSWAGGKDEPILIRIDGAGYRIMMFDRNRSHTFHGRLLRTGNAEILDLVLDDPSSLALPAHLPVRVWVEGDTLSFALLDTAWIKDQARREIACEEESGMLIATAPGDQVARFLDAYGGDERAYGNVETLERVR